MLAGAQRVEGCLFGNGERSGNVDLVTLALNFYSQGITRASTFSDINSWRAPWKKPRACQSIRGIHTSATSCSRRFPARTRTRSRKGMAAQKRMRTWEVPYIPVDPADLGRTYDSVIRVNSQSGKGGIAYLLERDYGVVMPRRMQVEFSALVQREMDASETEMTSQQLWALFESTYLATDFEVTYHAHHLFEEGDKQGIELEVTIGGARSKLRGVGSGPIAATVAALALPIRIDNYEERALRSAPMLRRWPSSRQLARAFLASVTASAATRTSLRRRFSRCYRRHAGWA
jgi:2-isopropylmalate synthase